jgi:hypothetical protein
MDYLEKMMKVDNLLRAANIGAKTFSALPIRSFAWSLGVLQRFENRDYENAYVSSCNNYRRFEEGWAEMDRAIKELE